MNFKDLRVKLQEMTSNLEEKWVEYNFNFGEDKAEGKRINKKNRKRFGQPSTLPGETNAPNHKS
jgi:hypothetical protein